MMSCRNCKHGKTSHMKNVKGDWMCCPCTAYVNHKEGNNCGCMRYDEGDFYG